MADVVFVLALVLPPAVVIVSFALLALPARREERRVQHSRAHAH